jgi:tetratricopeptide (TPR) repeat protein
MARDNAWRGKFRLAAILALGAMVLGGCDQPESVEPPVSEQDRAVQTFKEKVADMEGKLEGFQEKLKGVMERLKSPASPEDPAQTASQEEAAAGKPAPASPSEDLQKVMESLETPATPTEEAAAGSQAPPRLVRSEPMMQAAKEPTKPKKTASAPAEMAAPPMPHASAKTMVPEAAPRSQGRPRPNFGTIPVAPVPRPPKEDGPNHFDLGLAEWQQNHLQAAIGHFKAALAAEPTNAHAYWNLALIYDLKGEGASAIEMMEKAEAIYHAYGEREDMLKARERLLDWYKGYDARN